MEKSNVTKLMPKDKGSEENENLENRFKTSFDPNEDKPEKSEETPKPKELSAVVLSSTTTRNDFFETNHRAIFWLVAQSKVMFSNFCVLMVTICHKALDE